MSRSRSGDEFEAPIRALRKRLGIDDQFSPNLTEVATQLPEIFEGFKLVISEWKLGQAEAFADARTNKIMMSKSVHHDFVRGRSRARMTFAHELGHLASKQSGFRAPELGTFSAIESNAKRFAALFLIPTHLAVLCDSPEEIQERFGVSREAAKIRWKEVESAKRRLAGKARELPETVDIYLRERRTRGFNVTSLIEFSSGWLEQSLSKHERLAPIVEALTSAQLGLRNIKCFVIRSRVKSYNKAVSKIARKNYRNPRSELTDLTGVRIVTDIKARVPDILAIVRDLFEIDESNCDDKVAQLGVNRLGYRSLHLICKLKPEYQKVYCDKDLLDLTFEVQVRTIFEHVWAELARDHVYESSSQLPLQINRTPIPSLLGQFRDLGS